MMIRVGSFVKINPSAVRDPDDNLRSCSHKVFKVFAFQEGKVCMKCVGRTAQRTIVLGVDIQDLIAVNSLAI